MKKFAAFSSLVFLSAALFAGGEAGKEADFAESDSFELDRWYAGAGAALVLPQGGAGFDRVAGALVNAGFYMNEFWALEVEGAWCENRSAVAAGFLWHWWGYERIDPFFTFGACDWIDTDFGPRGGLGTFYHLDDHWSLRFDSTATMGVSQGCNFLYQFSLAIRRSW